MKDELKLMGWIAGATAFVVVLSLGAYAVVKPASVGIDNLVFHNSQAYQDGMANDLASFQQDYINATDQGKKDALRAVILSRYGSYSGPLPNNLQAFLITLRSGG